MPNDSELILTHPKEFFALQKRELDKELDEIRLSDEEINELRDKHAIEVFNDNVLGKIPGYKLAKKLLTWNSSVDKTIKEAKKEILLLQSIKKINAATNGTQAIINLLTNPCGNTIFNKVIGIIDDSPPDDELLEHLSAFLSYVAQSDFENLFSDHKYALAQIQALTPHSLTILKDYQSWPRFKPGSYSSNGGVLTSDWLEVFTVTYLESKQIANQRISRLVRHCINELISRRFVVATLQGEDIASPQPTEIGTTIIKYIKG